MSASTFSPALTCRCAPPIKYNAQAALEAERSELPPYLADLLNSALEQIKPAYTKAADEGVCVGYHLCAFHTITI
jgi:hypothetical protein